MDREEGTKKGKGQGRKDRIEGTGEKGQGRVDSGTVGQANNQPLLIKKGPLHTHSGRQKYGTHAINMNQRYHISLSILIIRYY